jgi:hypothetical protein
MNQIELRCAQKTGAATGPRDASEDPVYARCIGAIIALTRDSQTLAGWLAAQGSTFARIGTIVCDGSMWKS